MAGVRNGALGQYRTVGAGVVRVFSVPTNSTVLLKSIYLNNTGALDSDATLFVQHNAGAVQVVLRRGSLAAGAGDVWDGWIALNPLDELMLSASQAFVNVWASGAELPGVIDQAADPTPFISRRINAAALELPH